MKNFYRLTMCLFLLAVTLTAGAQLKKGDPLHVRNHEEAMLMLKVIKMEIGLDEKQQTRMETIFDNYIRRVESASKDLAYDSTQMNARLKILVENRDATIQRTLGEDKAAEFEALLPELRKKVAELKKRGNAK